MHVRAGTPDQPSRRLDRQLHKSASKALANLPPYYGRPSCYKGPFTQEAGEVVGVGPRRVHEPHALGADEARAVIGDEALIGADR